MVIGRRKNGAEKAQAQKVTLTKATVEVFHFFPQFARARAPVTPSSFVI